MENNLVDKARIIKELAEETGKSEKVIESVVNHSFKYISEIIAEDPEVLEINLPNLGVLKANYHMTLRLSYDNETAKKRMEKMCKEDDKKELKREIKKSPLLKTLAWSYKLGRFSLNNYYSLIKKLALKNNEKNRQIFPNS